MIYTSEPEALCPIGGSVFKESWYLYLTHSIQNVVNQENKNSICLIQKITIMFLLVSLFSSITYISLIMCCALSPNTLHDYKVRTLQKYSNVNPEKKTCGEGREPNRGLQQGLAC